METDLETFLHYRAFSSKISCPVRQVDLKPGLPLLHLVSLLSERRLTLLRRGCVPSSSLVLQRRSSDFRTGSPPPFYPRAVYLISAPSQTDPSLCPVLVSDLNGETILHAPRTSSLDSDVIFDVLRLPGLDISKRGPVLKKAMTGLGSGACFACTYQPIAMLPDR